MLERIVVMSFVVCFTPGLLEARQTTHTRGPAPEGVGPPAKPSDLDWLAGVWRGEGLGGLCEEVWLPAAGGGLIGMFRLIKEDRLAFSEFMSIVEESGTLVLKVKHFNPNLTGWEEKTETVDFRLVELGSHEAYFHGLTIRRVEPDRLEVFVAIQGEDGAVREEALRLQRVMD